MAVTSQIRQQPGFGEIIIEDWKTAGLLKASVIKPVIFTIEQRLVVRTLGQLRENDQSNIRQSIQIWLG